MLWTRSSNEKIVRLNVAKIVLPSKHAFPCWLLCEDFLVSDESSQWRCRKLLYCWIFQLENIRRQTVLKLEIWTSHFKVQISKWTKLWNEQQTIIKGNSSTTGTRFMKIRHEDLQRIATPREDRREELKIGDLFVSKFAWRWPQESHTHRKSVVVVQRTERYGETTEGE